MTQTPTPQTAELIALAETLAAADEHNGSWAWHAPEDSDQAGAYIDCSSPSRFRDSFALEVGDNDGEAIQLELSYAELVEVHRQLTVQLMIARLRDR